MRVGQIRYRVTKQLTLRASAALFSLGASAIHLAFAPEHFREWWGYGWFFLLVAGLQSLYAVGLVAPRRRLFAAPWYLITGISLNLWMAGFYVVTRTVGIPLFGAHAGHVEGLGILDVASKTLELGIVAALSVLLFWRQVSKKAVAHRLRLAGMTSVSVVATLVLLGLLQVARSGGAGTFGQDEAAAPGSEPTAVVPVETSDLTLSLAPAGYMTINVDMTEGGIQPALVLIPAGWTISLVLRNQTADERHYQVIGLTPIDPRWLSRGNHDTLGAEGSDEHDHSASFVDSDLALLTMCTSAAGVCPRADEVHLYAEGGGLDAMSFSAAGSGTFAVQDPLHPQIRGKMTVFSEGPATQEPPPTAKAGVTEDDVQRSLRTAAMVRELIPLLTRAGQGPGDSDLEAIYEAPLLFELTGRMSPEIESGGIGISFTVTQSIHASDLPEDALNLVLTVDGRGPFAPVRVRPLLSDGHHRTTHYLFPSKDGSGSPLIKGGHQVLTLSVASDDDCVEAVIAPLVWHLPISPSTPSQTLTRVSLADARVIQVKGSDSGFEPASLSLVKGQRVVLVFENTGSVEHHFHARQMPAQDILWLSSQDTGPMPSDINSLRSALFLPYHVCDSESGICPTGIDVHLHARAGGWLAISFVPPDTGTFTMTCPLHPEMMGTIVVSEK
ncbi:MAG: hypothetical protein HY676_04900 [Chloroflexi bacterium]|nr:hypothetical protein [Chloroflexota bacterium]